MTNVNSPQQFKLFMTGQEWKDQVTHSTDGPIDSLWAEKSARAAMPNNGDHGTGVRASIERYGYQQDRPPPAGVHVPKGSTWDDSRPTIILEDSPSGKSTRFVQSEGHHRIAAAADIEEETGKPVYIPTNYVDNTPSGRAARGEARGVRRVHGANALQRSGEAGA